ncbi:MAG: hypothetical protein WAQ25_00055 [Candidatus Saccharimonas sp.]
MNNYQPLARSGQEPAIGQKQRERAVIFAAAGFFVPSLLGILLSILAITQSSHAEKNGIPCRGPIIAGSINVALQATLLYLLVRGYLHI